MRVDTKRLRRKRSLMSKSIKHGRKPMDGIGVISFPHIRITDEGKGKQVVLNLQEGQRPLLQPLGPFQRCPHWCRLGADLGTDSGMELQVFVQHAKRVLAHFLAAKEFGQRGREVQAEL